VTTFALVHGAWHGPWCWERLRPELEARGHRILAVDLPSEDPSLGSADYAAVVTRALDDFDDDVVVVGHSSGPARDGRVGVGAAAPSVAPAEPRDRAYVLGALDHCVDPDWSRRATRERLGIEPIELDAGHSPFLTCPRELAELLG
jgi:Alpha/beta hydrolase family